MNEQTVLNKLRIRMQRELRLGAGQR